MLFLNIDKYSIYKHNQNSMYNYSYLRPSSQILKRDPLQSYSTNQNLISSRQLNNQKSEALHRLKQYVKHKYPNRQINENILYRYCQLGQFNTSLSVQKVKYYDDWWAMPAISKVKQRGILHSGVFYCYGRDQSYSPNIYFHPDRIDLKNFTIEDYLTSLRTLLTPIQQHMLVQGKIQQWNIIIDARNFNSTKFDNNYPYYVNNLFKISNAYPYRVKKIFLLSSNSLFSKINFVKNNQASIQQILSHLKLQSKVIKITNLNALDNYISQNQRQKQYGGKLEDLSQFWPISSTNKLMQVNSRFIQGSQKSDSEYVSINNDGNASYFNQKQSKPQPTCRCCIQ